MALMPRFAFFVFLLLPYQCEAKVENCIETQRQLLPVGDDLLASEFRFKASEKGVRLVYINLVIGNASYDPLELPDEFLPHRWIWANTIREPMLSLPEDYDMLSAGLLNFQVGTIDVKLKDQPSGCLAKLNSTCQNLAVGRMLLENVTGSSSGYILHNKRPVVCVAVLSITRTDDSSERAMRYHCCDMRKEARTGRVAIRCDQRIDVGNWVNTVNKIFIFLSFFLALFAPALPLALPDYVFSLEDEVEKENRPAEEINRETTGYQVMINDTEGEQDNQSGTEADRSDADDVPLLSTTSPEVEVVTVSSSFAATTTTANNNDNNINNGDDRLAEQTEVEKENCTAGYQGITSPETVGYQDQDDHTGTGADRSNIEDVLLLSTSTANDGDTNTATATAYNNDTIQEETSQNTSNCVGNSQFKEKESEFIPVDDSSPMNLSTLLRESVQKFPDIPLSFNIKLAVMCLCVYPCVFYIKMGLYHTLKKTSVDEIIKKHVLVGSVFSSSTLFVNVTLTFDEVVFLVATKVMTITIFILVLFLRPKDFFLGEKELCWFCRFMSLSNNGFNFSLASRRTLGDEIHRHLKILHHYVWCFTVDYGNIVVSIYQCLSLGCLRKKMRKESRGNHLFCVFFRLISFILALPFIMVGGVFCLLILLIVLIISLVVFSPVVTVGLFSVTKIVNRFGVQGKRVILGSIISFVVVCLAALYMNASILLLANSCLFVSTVVAYIIIGLALNVRNVTPFLAFLLVLTTNLYLCYAKLQNKYKEVKKMISERLQELNMDSDVPKDTIRAEIYWFVCDKVLPIKSEICRMLRNMVLAVAFLFLALSSIVFFGNEYDISTLTTTISVFFTGSIPPLFLKVLTTNSSIIGWAKIKMKREIDEAVTEYRRSRNGEATGHEIVDTRA